MPVYSRLEDQECELDSDDYYDCGNDTILNGINLSLNR